MLYFANDYGEGAHPEVLRRLVETNLEGLPGYGTDRYCRAAAEKIKAACACPEGEVFFTVGGTQTNKLVIDALLRRYEGVIAAATGHISVHEAGAVEAAGHKVLELPQREGKLSAVGLEAHLKKFYGDETHEHMVFPGMVYISHPTEVGTLYERAELEALARVCRDYALPLFLDGARLGYGLVSPGTDVTLEDVARCCDVFYIGGTKVGALCGEAVVFPRGNTPAHFVTLIKQHGALLAKGRLLGVQFDALFTDGLYTRISRNAIRQAETLREILRDKGYPFYLETPTNQIFAVLPDETYRRLSEQVALSFWEKTDQGHTVVRFATSWATRSEDVAALAALL